MSRLYTRIVGTGAGGYFTAATPDHIKLTAHLIPLQYNIELCALGSFARGAYAGGDWLTGIDASSAGDIDVLHAVPTPIDNTNSQLSGATNLVCSFRYYLRVSDAAITITPKPVYGADFLTMTTAATISGQAACSATAADFSGANQIQDVTVTLPAGVKYFKARFTVGGTPAAGLQAFVFVTRNLYIND